MYENENYPLLPKIAYAARWLDGFTSLIESLILSLSGLLLTVGISFSMFDFLTGGSALSNQNVFDAWALIQTIAIDTQFISMWYKSKLAFHDRQYIQAIGYALLGALLGFVTFGANAIPSLQSTLKIDFSGALSALGLNATYMVYVRSVVVIILAVIAAYNRTILSFNQSGEVQKNSPAQSQKIIPIRAKKAEKKEQKKSSWFARLFDKKIDENGEKKAPVQAEKSDKNLEETAQKNLLEIPQNVDSSAREILQSALTLTEQNLAQDDDTVMTKNAQDKNTDPQIPTVREVQYCHDNKESTNPPEKPDEPNEPEEKQERITGELTHPDQSENKTSYSDSNSAFTSSAPRGLDSVRTEGRGYTKEDAYNHPKIKVIYPRADARRRAVDKAWGKKDGIVIKSDGRARENGIVTWTRKQSKQSVQQG